MFLLDVSVCELYIFNRWGDLLFESNDMNQDWDETFS